MYAAHVDDKGRIKLPKDFQEYFAALGEKKLFVTTLDGLIGSIYTLPAWRHNLRVMADYTEDTEAAEDIGFLADDLGGQVEIDSQGRLLVPAEMRQEMGLENQAIRLRAAGERVDILSDKVYAERRARSHDKGANSAKLAKLKKVGLK
jgi:MraZ protein